jgi:hypothetical protein
MKKLFYVLLLFFNVLKSQAQDVQVTLVDPCLTIEKKSIIIINDNAIIPNNLTKTVTDNNTVNFTLITSANTSAGVYNASGNLIRTLWNGVRYDAGSYKAVWSGIMDDGTLAPPGNYQVRVLTNNVQYTWEGVIGNTSASLTDNLFKSYGGNTCFAFSGTKGFYGQMFYEGGTNSKYFNLNAIGTSHDVNTGVHASTLDCATDGSNIYWACQDQYQGNGLENSQSNYIFASKISDNSAVSFTNESGHNSGRENEYYSHFIGLETTVGNPYIGIAVNNNFIFATKNANKLLVFNKTSGSIVQTLSYTNPGRLAAGSNNELWMIVNGALNKYSVNPATGAIAPAGVTIAATNPVCIRISPDNQTVLVIDAGTQQVKAYSNSTGVLQWALGQAGGYDTNGPMVANDKFMFNRVANAIPTIAYQSDGSFWVNDIGNYRTLHFNADRTYKEQIMYMPSSRSTNADPNNPTRVFCDELEFQRDYTKPLDNGANGSWKLVKNWKVGTTLDAFRRFTQVVTLSNGHTYATGDNNLYDLTTTGAVLLSSNFEGTNFKIEADGSLYVKYLENNQYFRIGKHLLTGFASNFMPQWGAITFIATSPNVTPDAPFSFVNNTRGASTNPRYVFSFNPNHHYKIGGFGETEGGLGYHLGAIKTSGSNTWAWQTSKSTFFDYHGDYPRNGDFDVGNNDYSIQHSENCQALVQGTDIFWNVNAEFWKGGYGVNIWNHFNEDGLLIGNFGVTGLEASFTGEFGMAGNTFSTALVKVGSAYYIYHCDESRHGGVHSWRVTGLNTIAEQTIPIIVSAAIVPIIDASSLMAGIPYRSTNWTGNSIWQASGANMITNHYSNEKNDPEVYIATSGNATMKVKLATTALPSYNLTGKISMPGSEGSINESNDAYNWVELVDINNKIIAKFRAFTDSRNGYYTRILINNTTIVEATNGNLIYTATLRTSYQDIAYTYSAGTLLFKYSSYAPVKITTPYETGANIAAPAFLRVTMVGGQTHTVSFKKLRFVH